MGQDLGTGTYIWKVMCVYVLFAPVYSQEGTEKEREQIPQFAEYFRSIINN